MLSEKKKASNARWDKENTQLLACRIKNGLADELRIYADSQGLTISKFARLSMQYCKNNNINLQQEPEEENSEK